MDPESTCCKGNLESRRAQGYVRIDVQCIPHLEYKCDWKHREGAWEVWSEKNEGSWVNSEEPERLEVIEDNEPEWSTWGQKCVSCTSQGQGDFKIVRVANTSKTTKKL